MCLSIAAQIIEVHGDTAKVSVGGAVSTASLMLLGDVDVGDYVLVHAGFAMVKLNEEEARQNLALFEEIRERVNAENGFGRSVAG
jgi:hydrogenase expression/formation protein HypC